MTPLAAPTRPVSPVARVRGLVSRAVRLEMHMYASIARALARRPAIPPGATGFRYDGPILLLLVVLAVVSAVEVVAIDLVVHRWPAVRIVFLVIGLWGLVWMVGLVCAHVLRPHTVGPEGMRVRDGLDLDLAVAWEDVHAVGAKRHRYDSKPPRVLAADGTSTLVVPVSNETNLEVTLEKPTTVRLPGSPPKGGWHQVTVIRVWADDPRAFLREVSKHV